ncbi:MAG: bifunctional 4-hydroxy-2-oxoglutarate aldolase/2-dehydro-3-deoxy-phosphogluconate aldolase [Acidimicrobiia bacterium]|nr:bifunctional 4-hydroxy-2-oxoglutarate aldolase/2-dehydro-3-deoxy-phosphogluconate aldolase [Acidimicrobiia bacterium]
MAVHQKADVLATIRRDGVVPVFYNADVEVAREVARRLVSGGLSTIEFTNRGDGAIEVLADLIRWARRELPELIVGVGSVVDPATAGHVIDLGANFVFAPSLSAEVAAACNGRNIPYVPGCGTLTEIQTAYRLGSDFVRLFPAGSIGGPAFLRAVRAPCPWVQAVPTGGVEPTVDSMKAWFDAGAPAVGMGSKLLPGDLIRSQDWDGLEAQVGAAVGAVRAARSAG